MQTQDNIAMFIEEEIEELGEKLLRRSLSGKSIH